MDAAELDTVLRDVMEKGFDDSLVAFCARTFSSYDYPRENLPAARMHAHYLRQALEALCDPETKTEILRGGDSGFKDVSELDRLCLRLAADCYRDALSGEASFCELFVERWCAHFSSSR